MRRLLDIGDAVGHHPGPARQWVSRAGEVAVMVIDVGRADGLAQQLLEKVGFLVGGARRADAANRGRAMISSNFAQARGQHVQRLVPGGRLELSLLANKRGTESLRAVDELEAPASPV